MAVLRADSEVDRLRNLLILRRMERAESEGVQNSLQVVFMAQALERAGDHVKNLAEEVCHLATGHTLRHMQRVVGKPDEQMYLEHLRTRYQIGEPEVAMDENRSAR
jgi:phosphate transport system protein